MTLYVVTLFLVQLTPPPPTLYVDCESMHAAKIAQELVLDGGVPSCDGGTIPSGHSLVSAGAQLTGPGRRACELMTPNACAQHFRDFPEDGLKEGTGGYRAYHFGAPQDLRFPDGSRAMLYYKPGRNLHVDDWVFFLGGGAGLCAQKLIQRDSTTGAGWSSLSDHGANCYSALDYGNPDVEETVGKGFNMPRLRDFDGQGLLGDRPDNDFRDYNVVVLPRSSDYFIGNVTRTNVVVASETSGWPRVTRSFRAASLPLRGDAIVRAAIEFFETVPSRGGSDINAARRVLFASSSSGTNSVHRVDSWRDLVRDVTTRASGDTEPAYVALMASSSGVTPDSVGFEEFDGDAACGSVFAGSCGPGYDDPPSGVSSAWRTRSGSPIGFSETTFKNYTPTYWDGGVAFASSGVSDHGVAPGGEALPIASVSATPDGQLDASCLDTEPKTWKCRSTLYVMFNHLQTPLFIAHSLTDQSNMKGEPKGVVTRDASGDIPKWRDTSWLDTGDAPMAIVARFMFGSWARDRDDVGAAGAAGASKNSGPLGLWAPSCSGHEPEKSDEHFLRVRMGGLNLSQAVSRWFEGGEAGSDVVLLDEDGTFTVDDTAAGCN